MAKMGSDGLYHFDCVICGKPSVGHSSKGLICSNCKRSPAYKEYCKKYRYSRPKVPLPESSICITCGEVFKPTGHRQLNCPKCRKPSRHENRSRFSLMRGYYTKYCYRNGIEPISSQRFKCFKEEIEALPEGSGGKDIYDLIVNGNRNKNIETIEEIDRKARSEGISYGIYVARHYYK